MTKDITKSDIAKTVKDLDLVELDEDFKPVNNLKDLKIEETAETIHTDDGKTFKNQEAKDVYDTIVKNIKKGEDRKKHPVGSGIQRLKRLKAKKRERQNKKRKHL